jgi:hypothetical protein
MPVFCCSNQTAKQMQHAAHVLLFPFTQRLGIQPTSHSHRSGLQKDYQVARPHGILAETIMNTTVLASPRRLSTWDGVQRKRRIYTTAPCRQAADGGVSVHCS